MRKLILFLLLLTPFGLKAQTTVNGRVMTGELATRPTACAVADQFNTTDGHGAFLCNPTPNTWQPIGGGGTNYQTVEQAGVPLIQQAALNFPAYMTCIDNPSNLSTDCTPDIMVGAGASHSAGLVPDPGPTDNHFPLCQNGQFSSDCQVAVGTLPNPVLTGSIASGSPWILNVDTHFIGPNPSVDIFNYGARPVANTAVPPASAGITATITSGSATASISSASTFVDGDGVVIYGAGATNTMSTPGAPTVVESLSMSETGSLLDVAAPTPAAGINQYCYQIVARDANGGLTAASTETCTATNAFAPGSRTNTVSAISLSGNTVTVTTTAPHGLAVGAMFNIGGITSVSATYPYYGWFIVSGSTDDTHFTYLANSNSNAGTPTTGPTGGTITYWQNNHITWTAVTGAFQYYIYGRVTGGTKTLIGASWPQDINVAGDTTYLAFDDFGSTVTTLPTRPAYVPTTPPVAATNDMLITTIASGGGTTTLTLAATAGNNATNQSILLDSSSALLAAAAVANTNGVSVLIPSSLGGAFVFNAPMSIPAATAVIQRGTVTFNETVTMSNTSWTGEDEQGFRPSFAYTTGARMFVGKGNPAIYAIGSANLYNLNITNSNLNGETMILMDAYSAIPEGTISDVNLLLSTGGTDYMNMGIVTRGTHANAGVVWNFSNMLLSTSQNSNLLSCTPAIYFNNGGNPKFNNLFLTGKGVLLRPTISGAYLEADVVYTQGNYQPLFGFTNMLGGGTAGIIADIKNVTLDTTFLPVIANLGGLNMNATIAATVGVADLVSGVPNTVVYGEQSTPFSQSTGVETATTRVSANDGTFGLTTGFAMKTLNSSMVLGRGYSIFTNPVGTPAAPTCGTPTNGGAVSAGTYFYAYGPIYANGSEGKISSTCSATTSGSDLTVPLTWTAIDGAVAYNMYRGPAANNIVQLACSSPATTSASYTDTAGSACGQSIASTSSGGPAGIKNDIVWANNFVLAPSVAPTGVTSQTKSYMDSTTNWLNFKPNGNTAYQYMGVHGPITSGHSACFDSNVFASMVDCPGGGGGGSANPALQNSVAFYPDPGTATTIGGVNGLTTPDGVTQFWTTTSTGGIAGPPTPTLGGVIPTADASTSYIVVDTDRNSLRHFTAATPVAVTLPDASTWGSNPTFAFCVDGGGTVTFTPDAPSVISYWTGAVFTSAASSMSLTTGECITLFTDNIDYFASLRPGSAGNVTGNSLTGGQLIVGNSGSAITVGNLTGDVTTVASTATTLATVNADVGSFTAANITVNGKGLVTAASNGALGFPLTVTGGTTGHLPYFSNSTTLADAGTNLFWDPGNRIFQLGNPGASGGTLKFGNLAGGYATLTSTNVATNDAFSLPVAQTTSGNVLMSNNSHISATANFILNMATASGNAGALIVPTGTTAGTFSGNLLYDTGNGNFHVSNGADRILVPLAAGFVSGHCAQPTATANKWELVDLGAACAAGGSGVVTAGTTPRLAYYASSTTTVQDTGANLTWTSPVLTIGASASTTGQLKLASSTATGSVTLTPASAASDFTVTIPAASDTLVNLNSSQTLTTKTINATNNTLSNITGAMMTNNTVTATQIANNTVTGTQIANATITATQLAAQYSKGSCTEAWGGSGTSHAMTSGDDAVVNNTCYNDSGVTRTITAVKCRSDNAANTTVLTPTFGTAGTGTAILTGTVTCGNSYLYSATGTLANTAWTTGTGIDPGMSTVGNATSIAVIIEYTY